MKLEFDYAPLIKKIWDICSDSGNYTDAQKIVDIKRLIEPAK
jgi:hypothetical protein